MSPRDHAPSTCAATPKSAARWLGDDPVQPLCCETCDEPTTASSFIEGLGRVICPLCLEMAIDAQTTEQRL